MGRLASVAACSLRTNIDRLRQKSLAPALIQPMRGGNGELGKAAKRPRLQQSQRNNVHARDQIKNLKCTSYPYCTQTPIQSKHTQTNTQTHAAHMNTNTNAHSHTDISRGHTNVRTQNGLPAAHTQIQKYNKKTLCTQTQTHSRTHKISTPQSTKHTQAQAQTQNTQTQFHLVGVSARPNTFRVCTIRLCKQAE